MAITIQEIKELREATAAGMGACKEALTATNGNMEEAIKYLREKGLAVAAKRVDKESKQGIIALAEAADKKTMALAEVNCETDFVAKTEAFIKFVDDAAKVALEGKDIEATLNDDYKMLLTKTGENVKIRRSERYALEGAGVLSGYIHMGGKVGVLVLAEGEKNDTVAEVLHDVALQIAAASPVAPEYVTRDQVNPDHLKHETDILAAQARNEGKPEKIIEKMVEGRIKKQLKEICLFDQTFVRSDLFDGTVAGYVAQVAKELGADIKIVSFERFEKGEGIQKREENFAEEIAKLTNK